MIGLQLEKEGVEIVIGPVFHKNLIYLEEVQSLTFLSLSNKTKKIPKNVITFGINAISQINAIVDFIKKEKLNKTIVIVPKSNFEDELKNALVKSKYKFFNIYSYDAESNKLTSQIEQITAYTERKKNLEKIIKFTEKRIEILEKEEELENFKKKYIIGEVNLDSVVVTENELKKLKKQYVLLDNQINEEELENFKKKYAFSNAKINKNELENLKKKYTIGKVKFDSVVIADFGENLKSVTNSFSFSDVTAQDVKFITLNQWFDHTLLVENSANKIYFPSIKLKNYSNFREIYFEKYNKYPQQISILSYDILGLIYFLKKKQNENLGKNIFDKKMSYIGEVGEFSFEDKVVNHKLNIYQISNKQFLKINK